jgi:hypothetical protein
MDVNRNVWRRMKQSLDKLWNQMIPSLKRGSQAAIEAAKEALERYSRFWLGNPGKVESELYELGLLSDGERYMAIDIALQEISPACRLGPEPPHDLSSHPPFYRQSLYAFRWDSGHFGKMMYLKFALVSGSGGTRLALYSFHESTERG